MTLFLLIAALFVCTSIHSLGIAVTALLLGAKVEEIGLFMGPKLFGFRVGGILFRVNALPLGSFVKLADGFEKINIVSRSIVALSGCLALILTALAVFGFAAGWHQFVSGFGQIFGGTFSPGSEGARLVSAAYGFAAANSFLQTIGMFAAKMAAFNLLPIPMLNGGQFLIYLLQAVFNLSDSAREKINIFGLLALLLLYCVWLYAVIAAIF